MPRIPLSTLLFCSCLCTTITVEAQTLNMKDAVKTGITNYGTIKAKSNYADASKQYVEQAKRNYIPVVTLSAQQDYGTVNGQNGPLSGLGGLNVASSGPTLASQNWNAAFGALYLSSINWDFFTFGRIKEQVKVAQQSLKRDQNDLGQEIFQQEIRVSAAYLNLLAAQRLAITQKKNLDRAIVFKNDAVARAANGLLAGVDSTLANAEVSAAKILLTNAIDLQQQQANALGVLLSTTATDFTLDTTFVNRVPKEIMSSQNQDTSVNFANHPTLQFLKNRVDVSNEQTNYYKRLAYPTFTALGVFQGRGSGFPSSYGTDQSNYSTSYGNGVNPVRANYLVGVGVVWNLTTILRNAPQVRAQRYTTMGLQNEYDLVDQQLHSQLALSQTKIKNALANYVEAPKQVQAATQAYLQKSALYKNGLATLVDLTTALFALNRAESDQDIAYTNVWQALLLKSAAVGDYNIFINEF
ncbi:TolC family protein [Pedobacter sp. L105]|uniref:TolC family protein n=1 Tax=Pedobacter sp. L105 TaxID=1641871 RepID=UPI00131DCF02|nr:TolC family protein [Pedobacter sp. L105]